ncbi:hypothetical protein ACFOQM_23560 [Paenibacillus sp. GCM10012307]|uniref:Uncharacterized protein n=1 Tax=Paenibacillus roseus TaxID=2798579 RepID=A0A934J3Q9_9BACL|nr:hypothetical protein [Paenibacillus roseus]MBJ6364201.1 hypothetical protein [Paenibacillus roseus]
MILSIVDPAAGTHFTGKIFVTPHACDRAVEYFGIERKHAPLHVMDLVRKSALIDPHVVGEGSSEPARLFAYDRFAFVVNLREDAVITIYPRQYASEQLRKEVGRVLKKVLTASQREEKQILRKLALKQAELNVAKAEAELRLLKTNLTKVKRKLSAEIAEIVVELTRIEDERLSALRRKTTLAKDICAYV